MWELRKTRLYGDNPSIEQSQSGIAPRELQGVAGGGGSCGETNTGISVCSSNVGSTTVCSSGVLCVYFLLAPPIPLGAWSMALVLCQRREYHYNYYYYYP